MPVSPLLNAAGRRRSPVTLPGYLAGRPPRNKGLRYPPDPPTVEEIVAVMRAAGDGAHGVRMRALMVLLWRAGLRINEALTVTEHDLDARLQYWSATARATGAARSAWTRGAGTTSGHGSNSAWRYLSARCCA
jgi:integrase